MIYDILTLGVSRLNITFVIDENYLDQLLFVMYKCFRTSTNHHNYFVFHENLSSSAIKKIEKLSLNTSVKVSVIRLEASNIFFDNGHIARSSMLRLSVIQEMNTPYMHLDVDTLPRSGWDSIEKFMPSPESIIAAVKQPGILQIGNKSRNQAIQLMGESYFQTGIFLINPKRWILDDLQTKTEAAVKNYDNYGFEFSDQCILNFVVGHKYSSLPSDFNSFPINARIKLSKIIHFAGPNKPWNVKIFKFTSLRFRAALSARSTSKLILKGQVFRAFCQLHKRFQEFSNEFFWIVIYKVNFKFFLRLFRNIQ